MIKNLPVILIEDIDQDDGKQLGFATLETWHTYLFMRLLYVQPSCRRLGVATRLLDRAKLLAESYSGLALVPENWADEPMRDTQLREWYLRQGFNPCQDTDGVLVWTK